MAEIRLQDVTKTFKGGGVLSPARGARSYMRGYQDRQFAERVAATEDMAQSQGGAVRALDSLSLTINDGETMSIVGPSGCGKTTLLRVVAGLEPVDEGAVYFDDQDMTNVSPADRGIGMVFQSYALYPHMKGQGNLAFFFKVRNRPTEEMMERIRITAEIMGIGFDALMPRKPGTLSGGQQQRVAIGRCIVRDPTLFLFDEPLSNLDAKLRSSTRVEIKRLLHRFNITAIYVTHDQVEAITLGDRIAVMRAGRIEQVGTYQEITSAPVNAFVAGFLGLPPMNLLGGWRVTGDGELVSDFGRTSLPSSLAGVVEPNQEIILGFRSEGGRILLEDKAARGEICITAEVLNCEPNFARRYQVINVQAAETIFGVQAPLDMRINTGWAVRVAISEESAYFFDKESEARLVRTE